MQNNKIIWGVVAVVVVAVIAWAAGSFGGGTMGGALATTDALMRTTVNARRSLKPNQNAYIESFNGRFRDECLNEHWFTSVPHAQSIIETWRCEYNDERPKKALGGLTPAAYARQLTAGPKVAKVTAGP